MREADRFVRDVSGPECAKHAEVDGFAGGRAEPEWAEHMKASSSNGRAAVSKTACWGFESLLACQLLPEEGR